MGGLVLVYSSVVESVKGRVLGENSPSGLRNNFLDDGGLILIYR
jgi:hypothetical protein